MEKGIEASIPTDIHLLIGDVELAAHKYPLAVASPILNTLISQNSLISRIQLPNVFAPSIWSTVVRSVYETKGAAIELDRDAVISVLCALDALDIKNDTRHRVERMFETDILSGGAARKWQAWLEIQATAAIVLKSKQDEPQSESVADRSTMLQLNDMEANCIRIRDQIEAALVATPALCSVITNALLSQCTAHDLLRLLQQESTSVSAAEKALMLCRFLDLKQESPEAILVALSTSFRKFAARFDTPLLLAILHYICDIENEWLVEILAQRSHELSPQNCSKINLGVLTRILLQAEQRWFASTRTEHLGCAFYALIDGIAETRLAGNADSTDSSEVSRFLSIGLASRRAHDLPLLKWVTLCGAGTLPRETFTSLLGLLDWSRVSFSTLLELIEDAEETVPARVLIRALAKFTQSTIHKLHDGIAAARSAQVSFADSKHKVVPASSIRNHSVANGLAVLPPAPAFNKAVASNKVAGSTAHPPTVSALRFADCAALPDLRRCVDALQEPAAAAAAASLRSVEMLTVGAAANPATQQCA